MATYTLYGFTNDKSISVDRCIMYFEDVTDDKTLITFSELYYKKNFYKNEFPLKPSDFKYIQKISLKTDNILVVKTKNDYIPNMFSENGRLDIELIKKTLKRNIEGCVLYHVQDLDKSDYVPILYLPKTCIIKVSLSYKQIPLERQWMSVEDCKRYNKFECINSQSCILSSSKRMNKKKKDNQQHCEENAIFQLLRLQDLKSVMLPYKFYSFTEYETSMYNTDVQYTYGFKPMGFWFSQGDGWLQHMKKTNFKMNSYNYLYELEVDLNECILIRNLKDLYNFTRKFCSTSKVRDDFCLDMNWNKVVQTTNKSGIIISPNLKEIILKYKNNDIEYFRSMEWYITWDIASGAIWNKKALKQMRLIYQKEEGYFVEYDKKL